jgi:hypothetical protein
MTESKQTKNTREGYWHKAKCEYADHDYSIICDCHLELRKIIAQTKQETIQACKDALPKEGVIVAPENVGTSESPVLYKETLARNKTIAAAHKALNKLGDN